MYTYNDMYFYIPNVNDSMGKMDYSAKKHDFIKKFNTICKREDKDISTIIKNASKFIDYSKLQKALCNSLNKENLVIWEIIVLCKINKFSFDDTMTLLDTMLYGIPFEIKRQLHDEWENNYTDEEYYDLIDYFKIYSKPNPDRITV